MKINHIKSFLGVRLKFTNNDSKYHEQDDEWRYLSSIPNISTVSEKRLSTLTQQSRIV